MQKNSINEVMKPTKMTVCVPHDLYREIWNIIGEERSSQHKITVQNIMINALRQYLSSRKEKNVA